MSSIQLISAIVIPLVFLLKVPVNHIFKEYLRYRVLKEDKKKLIKEDSNKRIESAVLEWNASKSNYLLVRIKRFAKETFVTFLVILTSVTIQLYAYNAGNRETTVVLMNIFIDMSLVSMLIYRYFQDFISYEYMALARSIGLLFSALGLVCLILYI